jgi:hypothetical protein
MRLLALTGAALLAVGLAGCSAPADDTGAPDAPDVSASAEPDARPDASKCGGITTEDLIGLFGVDLDGPDASTGNSDQNGVTWTSTGCDWESQEEKFEVDLDISQGSDFPNGTVTCIEPGGSGEVTAVEGIGNQAWWKFEDFNEVEGELRVCTDDQLVEFAVDADAGSLSSEDLLEKAKSAVRIVVE